LRKLDGREPLKRPAYGGHFAVTRSLVEGLRKAGLPFVYNPRRIKDCTPDLIALSGLQTLEQAIGLRKAGIVKRLAAGPNIVGSPADNFELLGSEWIERYIVNSDWTRNMYAGELPSLDAKLIIWPAGVDEEYWKPEGREKDPRSLLFYSKRPDKELFDRCIEIAEAAGCRVTVLEYGSYTPPQYKQLLNEHAILVHFTPSESQGISLAESWSVDVPTLVWNQGVYVSHGKTIPCSSAPFLSDPTGLFFRDAPEFAAALDKAVSAPAAFSPRKWILDHLTDEISARHLIQLLEF
jgi:glycosyltransferase involved in cell wall biosynthesis